MKLAHSIADFRKIRKKLPSHARIGLVPTMGALHDGHGSLVKKSVSENDFTIVSIFVNPTQFGPNEDFSSYPRNLEQDSQLLEKLGVDLIFAPNTTEVYPTKSYFFFEIKELSDKLCGASRPGHMNGVAQVVSILFHICQPTHAYFGLKDYQQCLIIQHLVKEFHFPMEIVPCPIIREADGLAMSSRNLYLSIEERKNALFLYNTLTKLKRNFQQFKSHEQILEFVYEELLTYSPVKLDYFELLNGDNLENLENFRSEVPIHAFVAAFSGKTRLIDNMRIKG